MIAQNLATSAGRDELKWRPHVGEKQRSARRQGYARAVPAGNRTQRSVSRAEWHARPSADRDFEAIVGDLVKCPG
jgi:hypothetical protein